MDRLSTTNNLLLFFMIIVGIGLTGVILAVDGMKPPEITEGMFLEWASMRFAEAHTYNATYDCVDYTADYIRVMEQLGFEVSPITGCNETMCHRWAAVHINPQTGEFDTFKYDWEW